MSELSQRIVDYAMLCSQRPVPAPTVSTNEVDGIADAALRTFSRYQGENRPGAAVIPLLRLFEARHHCTAYLLRSDFYRNLPTTPDAADEFASGVSKELLREQCSVASLVLIDGLELPAKEVRFQGGRLFELDKQSIHEWFQGEEPPGEIRSERIIGVAALELLSIDRNPPWTDSYFYMESAARRIQRVAEPWVTYINLVESRKCRTTGMYQRSDSLLHDNPFRDVGVQEPMWEMRFMSDPDGNGDDYEYEELHRTLELDDANTLAALLNLLETGRAAAAQRMTHRVETALRCFSRVSEVTLSHDLAIVADLDECEDIIIDSVVGLETIFLAANERDKMDKIANGAAGVLESDYRSKRAIRKEAKQLYKLRSAILHGDARADAQILRRYSQIGEQLLRRSIIAFCGAEGDQTRILHAEADAAMANAIRASIPI